MTQNKITTEQRTHDFIAYLNDDRGKWESGKTRAEAIGKLIASRCSEMNIEIDYEPNEVSL